MKIYVVRDEARGDNAMAFRSERKAEAYKELLRTRRKPAVVDEVELDDEVPELEVGPPHFMRLSLNVDLHFALHTEATVDDISHERVDIRAKFLSKGEQLRGNGAEQAYKWAVAEITNALGDSLEEIEQGSVEVLDEQGRRVQG